MFEAGPTLFRVQGSNVAQLATHMVFSFQLTVSKPTSQLRKFYSLIGGHLAGYLWINTASGSPSSSSPIAASSDLQQLAWKTIFFLHCADCTQGHSFSGVEGTTRSCIFSSCYEALYGKKFLGLVRGTCVADSVCAQDLSGFVKLLWFKRQVK